MRSSIVIVLLLALAVVPLASAQADREEQMPDEDQAVVPAFEERVEVIGVTPIHGLGVSEAMVPANIQTATAADIERMPGSQISEVLATGFATVNLNEAQSNPFQPDVQFRGFAVSPLLGLPQGVAVYQDGVRVNEPFGDTLNWDLLPTTAISSINLIPGSNPLFGLNALGGALSVQTKTGFTSPGHSASVLVGSFGRVWADVQSASHTERLGYFVAARILSERGWRDFSDSRVRQLFGSIEWRDGSNVVRGSVTGGANRLIGNGPAPVQLLQNDRRSVFTHPDETKTELGMITVNGQHFAGQDVSLDGVFYFRPANITTFNGDDTNYEACDQVEVSGLLCDEAGEPVIDPFGRTVSLGAELFDATNNTASTRSRGWGGSLQASVARPLRSRPNSFIAGASIDSGHSRYGADTEIANFTETRGTVGTGIVDAGAAVRLDASVLHLGVYAADFLTLASHVTLMASARLTHSRVELRDRRGNDLNGLHTFTRLNPAVGVTISLLRRTTVFGSVSAASRVPTPSELSCADPEDPCRLPNAFVADPPLDQVVAGTWEGGVRQDFGLVRLSASGFRTSTRSDIVFISSGSLTNQGHFENVGDTLRRGVEVGAAGSIASGVEIATAYSYLRATFDTPFTVSSPNHPDAEGGEIVVPAGSSLPSVPKHNFKAGISAEAGRTSLAVSLVALSGQYVRGDEANLLRQIPGFVAVDVAGGYTLSDHMRLVGRVSNLFDAEYETFGLLGDARDVLGEDFDDPRFVSPAGPRAAWAGVEVEF